MSRDEHLDKILAKLDSLIAGAKLRTPGRWYCRFNGHYHEIQTEDVEYAPAVAFTCPMPERESNATFIASCAGNAEAGWVATRAAIVALVNHKSFLDSVNPTPCKADAKLLSTLDSIIAAWPEEIL